MLAGALQRRAIRKMLLAGALQRRAIGKMLLAGAPWESCWPGHRGELLAGRGAAAELLQAGNRRHRGLPAGALQRRSIGKMLLARAPQWQRYCWPGHRGELLEGALRQRNCCKGEPSGRGCKRGALWQSCCRQPLEGITAQKKRVTPEPSWTCGSPSCLLTTCYGCLRFAIS